MIVVYSVPCWRRLQLRQFLESHRVRLLRVVSANIFQNCWGAAPAKTRRSIAPQLHYLGTPYSTTNKPELPLQKGLGVLIPSPTFCLYWYTQFLVVLNVAIAVELILDMKRSPLLAGGRRRKDRDKRCCNCKNRPSDASRRCWKP
jgi:hypothetical protein